MMKGTMRMNAMETERMAVMGQVESGQMTLKAAALEMGVSYRQARRIAARWRKGRAWGLVHGGRDRISNRRLPEELRLKALEACQTRCEGFGPTLAARSTWAKRKGSKSAARRSGAGSWRTISGSRAAADVGANARGASGLANLCNWTAASIAGWRIATIRPA